MHTFIYLSQLAILRTDLRAFPYVSILLDSIGINCTKLNKLCFLSIIMFFLIKNIQFMHNWNQVRVRMKVHFENKTNRLVTSKD